jgi:hypothetical protein
MATLDITGHRFGRLVALRIEPSPLANTRWRCRCDCGEETVAILGKLRNGHTKSCGCLRREIIGQKKRTHGRSGGQSRLYKIWTGMRGRCNTPTNTSYRNYGGRGIRICSEWNGFEAFEKWALSHGYSHELTIERIDNDRGYEPSNCRWATKLEQARNSRHVRSFELNGKIAGIAEHAADAGLNYWAVMRRIRNGKTPAEAILELAGDV